MNLRSRQLGLGWFGMLFVLGTIALVAIIVVKTLPIYMNQMKIASSVNKVASDPENGQLEVSQLRKNLARFWEIENIDYLDPKEVNVKRTEAGRFLSYEYEARESLFYNISIVLEFADDVPLSGQ